jgi:acyl dehydratase
MIEGRHWRGGQECEDLTVGETIADLCMSDSTFQAPLFDGDSSHSSIGIAARRLSNSRQDVEMADFIHSAFNQDGKLVTECRRQAFMPTRPEA